MRGGQRCDTVKKEPGGWGGCLVCQPQLCLGLCSCIPDYFIFLVLRFLIRQVMGLREDELEGVFHFLNVGQVVQPSGPFESG